MGSIVRKYLIVIYPILFVSLCTQLACDRKGKGDEKAFDYGKIIRDEYRIKVGKVVPLTIEQSIEIDGDLSRDGLFFFYSSNRERGNFDIYLRALEDITTVRITQHPSKDTSPAISPDGKHLAFVSQREDPEGDIYVVSLKPDGLIEKAKKSVLELPSLDKEAVNVTLYQDPVTKTVKIIKDASPCWSPDGEWIAFSSTRDGTENIWIMDRNGEKLRRVTEKGGMYPRFSENGEQIIYVSYRDADQKGEIYVLDLKIGRERRITNTKSIELSPTFMGNNNEIVYTLIDRDTNANGKLDLKDNSVLFYKNLRTGLEYPLTLYSQSSFTPRWFSLYAAPDVGYRGVIVYSDQIDENININVYLSTV